MDTHQIPLPDVYKRLSGVSSSLGRHFAEVAPVLETRLSPEDFATWAQYCETLAQSGWRAWESAEAFCHVSPFLLQHIDPAALWQWAETGKVFARNSADVATSFFRAARIVAPQHSLENAEAWIAGGHWYLKHHPAQPSLTAAYFQASPAIYTRFAAPVCDIWQRLGHRFAQTGVPKARAFFDLSQSFVDQEHISDPSVPWELAERIAPLAADLALQFLERYPDLALRLGTELVALVHDIATTLLAAKVAHATTFLRVLNGTMALLSAGQRRQGLEWCRDIAEATPEGMLAFLDHLPTLMPRLPSDRLQLWVDTGLALTAQNIHGGQAYFALESSTALERLHSLQGHVAFEDVQRVLQLYTEGFTATKAGAPSRRFELRSTEQMPSGLQRGDHDLPTSDGTALYVPGYVDTFDAAPENFAVYKVAILHQLGFYDCGTFTFRLDAWRRHAPQVQKLLPQPPDDPNSVSAFEQFFSSFDQPEYARQLFTLLEDARIDAYLSRQFKGIRQDLSRLMQQSLTQRPDLTTLPLRQALLEGMLQLTLGGDLGSDLPPALRILLQRLHQRTQAVEGPDATVYETATAVTECYHLIMQIPQHAMSTLSPETLRELAALADGLDDDADMMALADMFQQAGEGADTMPIMPESDEPAIGTEPVQYRGELKPDLIEKKLQLQELTEQLDKLQDGLSPLPPEVLKELLENGEVEISSLQEGDLTGTSGLFLSDLEGRQNEIRDALAKLESLQEAIDSLDADLGDALGDLASVDYSYLYDEWDYQIQDYRRGWCRLSEIVLPEDDTSFIEKTKQRHAELLNQIRQQFQLLKPELFKKMKRLTDGEEIDLDSAIEARVDRRAGNMPSDKVYTRRQKRDRDVAAVFLLDMSASTDDEVPETSETSDTQGLEAEEPTPPRKFDFSGLVVEDYYQAAPNTQKDPDRRRIIDVEKEALVLMAEALETLGDAYAVYGFSGYGRDQVDFFVAKEFTDAYDGRTKGRISAMKPHRSTRMGPAIRHAVSKLERQDARIKTLLMLSDGYPQDFDYGKDRKSKDYGIQDTMMALREAQLKGIQTFCITVDPSGHDYLREMCPDQQYLIIDDITALPDELPKVYRGLTT